MYCHVKEHEEDKPLTVCWDCYNDLIHQLDERKDFIRRVIFQYESMKNIVDIASGDLTDSEARNLMKEEALRALSYTNIKVQ